MFVGLWDPTEQQLQKKEPIPGIASLSHHKLSDKKLSAVISF